MPFRGWSLGAVQAESAILLRPLCGCFLVCMCNERYKGSSSSSSAVICCWESLLPECTYLSSSFKAIYACVCIIFISMWNKRWSTGRTALEIECKLHSFIIIRFYPKVLSFLICKIMGYSYWSEILTLSLMLPVC